MKFVFLLFSPILFSFISDYNKVNTIVFDNTVIEYGSVVSDNDSDGYIKFFDKEDEILLKEIHYDSKANDYFRYLAVVDKNTFLIVCDSYYFNEEYTMPIYRDSIVLKYNLEGELLDKLFLSFRPNEYHNHNHLLILKNGQNNLIINKELRTIDEIDTEYEVLSSFEYQYQGIAYVNDELVDDLQINYPGHYNIRIVDANYIFDLFVTVEADYKILGDKYVAGYLGEVSFYSFGDLYLNDKVYNIGSSINDVGNHHMLIIGENGYRKDVFFVILPDISYNNGDIEGQLLNDAEFNTSIRIYSNAQAMFLDGEFYNSEYINQVGLHNISFIGINGYTLDLTFSIYPKISGVEDGNTYENVTFIVFGEALLNEDLITGEITLNEPGEYKLELLFEGEIFETLIFNILAAEEIIEENEEDYTEYFKYIFIFLALIGGMLFLRKR
ncbi:MAG: hypothetical protein CVV60_00175 [Tenericutes bacterium HGW-Tenericutes-5]|jgi:hypothetical protein|nr:MAG: hypothetical protein CVV60_00175 [Tenericutes bacterium HGW-Tenericutes-5]